MDELNSIDFPDELRDALRALDETGVPQLMGIRG